MPKLAGVSSWGHEGLSQDQIGGGRGAELGQGGRGGGGGRSSTTLWRGREANRPSRPSPKALARDRAPTRHENMMR